VDPKRTKMPPKRVPTRSSIPAPPIFSPAPGTPAAAAATKRRLLESARKRAARRERMQGQADAEIASVTREAEDLLTAAVTVEDFNEAALAFADVLEFAPQCSEAKDGLKRSLVAARRARAAQQQSGGGDTGIGSLLPGQRIPAASPVGSGSPIFREATKGPNGLLGHGMGRRGQLARKFNQQLDQVSSSSSSPSSPPPPPSHGAMQPPSRPNAAPAAGTYFGVAASRSLSSSSSEGESSPPNHGAASVLLRGLLGDAGLPSTVSPPTEQVGTGTGASTAGGGAIPHFWQPSLPPLSATGPTSWRPLAALGRLARVLSASSPSAGSAPAADNEAAVFPIPSSAQLAALAADRHAEAIELLKEPETVPHSLLWVTGVPTQTQATTPAPAMVWPHAATLLPERDQTSPELSPQQVQRRRLLSLRTTSVEQMFMVRTPGAAPPLKTYLQSR
jgi:hypothetical protein